MLLMRTRTAHLIPPLLLVTAGLAGVTTSSATAAEPVPSPVWNAVVGSGSSIYSFGESGSLDVYGANSYRVDTVVDPATPAEASFVYEVYDARGARTFRSVGTSEQAASAATVDAGAWGAVVGGRIAGEFVPGTSAGGDDGWVRRYAPNGAILWTTQLGTEGSDAVSDLVVLGNTVVAVGSSGAGDGTLLYTLDLATGAASGPLTTDVPEQEASLSSIAVLGTDVVVSGSTTRDIDLAAPMSSEHQWIARLRGADLTQVVWETNGTAGSQSGTPFGRPLTVVGTDVYTSSLTGSSVGYLTSYAGATGAQRWSRALGIYQAVFGLTSYRGHVVLAGLSAAGMPGGDVPEYNSLLQGWTTAGTRAWSTHVPQDASNALVFLIDVAASPEAGLVAIGSSGDGLTATGSAFMTALRVRAPRALVKLGGTFRPTVKTVIRRGKTKTATIRLTNVGELADQVSLKGCVVPYAVKLSVKAGRKNVTAAVRKGTYRTPALAPGQSTALTVKLVVDKLARLRTVTCGLVSSSVANPANTSKAVLTFDIRK